MASVPACTGRGRLRSSGPTTPVRVTALLPASGMGETCPVARAPNV
jgi:hypothetical protein